MGKGTLMHSCSCVSFAALRLGALENEGERGAEAITSR